MLLSFSDRVVLVRFSSAHASHWDNPVVTSFPYPYHARKCAALVTVVTLEALVGHAKGFTKRLLKIKKAFLNRVHRAHPFKKAS